MVRKVCAMRVGEDLVDNTIRIYNVCVVRLVDRRRV